MVMHVHVLVRNDSVDHMQISLEGAPGSGRELPTLRQAVPCRGPLRLTGTEAVHQLRCNRGQNWMGKQKTEFTRVTFTDDRHENFRPQLRDINKPRLLC